MRLRRPLREGGLAPREVDAGAREAGRGAAARDPPRGDADQIVQRTPAHPYRRTVFAIDAVTFR